MSYGLPSWPQKANKIRRAQKHLHWLREMRATAEEEGLGDLLDTYESATAELEFYLSTLRCSKEANSPTFTPGH